MKRAVGGIRALCGAGLLAAASAAGCNAIIGLEVGELDPSTGGAGATSSSASSGDGGSAGDGAGAGGAGDGGGAGGAGGGGGGEEALCSYVRAGDGDPPAGEWGALAGREIVDIAAGARTVTALVNGPQTFSVARWTDAGALDSGYGMEATLVTGSIRGERLAIGGENTYIAGSAEPGAETPVLTGGCQISAKADLSPRVSFVAALDEKGACQWAWSVDAVSNTTPLDLVATPESVLFALSLSGAPTTSSGACTLGSGANNAVAELISMTPSGTCRWSQALGPWEVVRIAALVVDPRAMDVLVIGDYSAPDGAIAMQGKTLPRSLDSDLFVARVRLADGGLRDVTTINAPGRQAAARHGAALMEDGDVVIAGTYSGPSFDFEDDQCPSMPPAGEKDNTFVLRVSDGQVLWSRGFGDEVEDQLVTRVAVDEQGSIYVTGTLEGEIDLGNGPPLTAPPGQIASFLIVMNEHGNVLSSSALVGEETVWTWRVAPGPTLRDPLYIAGQMTKSFYLVPSDHPIAEKGEGFIARLAGLL
ncbi:hypothetical protein [Sorangium sp. So ce131]|uniref:hypothetical protein n=1 Tax=Sorangium sp. So ce131 TaxID=3133282 RepID=UPI003F647416